MKKLTVLDLFSGIGGFSLGLERTNGFETVAFCEKDKHCQKVLRKHWPKIPTADNIEELYFDTGWDGHSEFIGNHLKDYELSYPEATLYAPKDYFGNIDVIAGGFPCQDISIGGKQKGLKGERSGLWKEYKRLIEEIKPKYAIIENVERLRKNGLGVVLRDLSEIGYDAEWHCITAKSVGYPHTRDRLFIIAYPSSERLDECTRKKRHIQIDENRENKEIYAERPQCQSKSIEVRPILSEWAFNCLKDTYSDERTSLSNLCRVTDGIPEGLDEKDRKRRIKQLGNAIVPRIAEIIGKAILIAEKGSK